MCGIAGYKAFGQERPTKEEVIKLLIGIEERGKDATGVAWFSNYGLQIKKAPITASEFIHEINENIYNSHLVLLHTRAATNGEPKHNQNNHPIFNKNGMALIHNGIIYNHNELFKKYRKKRDGEVDSEIILRLIEDGWWNSIKDKQILNELDGSFAIAAIWDKRPNELILARSKNPIILYMDAQRDILFWASTETALRKALQKKHRGFPINNITCFELENDTAILVKDKIEDFVKIETPIYYGYYWGTTRKYPLYDKEKDFPPKKHKFF